MSLNRLYTGLAEGETDMVVNPRCMVGISPETLDKLKEILENDKEANPELKEAIDRMIEMANEEIEYQRGGEN